MQLHHSELMMGKAELLGEIWAKERFSQAITKTKTVLCIICDN